MTESKPAEFAKGDAVTYEGDKLVVVNQGSPGGAVLCETPPNVKPYRSTFYPADALKKGRASKAKKDADDVRTFTVNYTDDAGESQTVDVEAANEDEALEKFAALDHSDATVVDVTKQDA